MLKMALFDCAINEKKVAVLTEDGTFALFFSRGILQLKSPHSREFGPRLEKLVKYEGEYAWSFTIQRVLRFFSGIYFIKAIENFFPVFA